MKKALSLLMVLVMTFSLCVGLISCGNSNTADGDKTSTNNPGDDSPNTSKPFNVDLAGYVANIGNATAIGISKKAKANVSPVASYETNKSGIQLLSYNTLASGKDTEDKNYIVMSTTDYDANAPEADKTGLTKVTFTKIVTENVTTETTGTKYIIANEGTISILATEGFMYTVYHNASLVYSEVKDNDHNDKDEKNGVIVLDNLIDGIEYRVDYKGIGVETTITQDDINGEIDKLYVLNGYTFISFVPLGTSQRPSDNELVYDSTGVATYDKTNYFSGATRQSFVIDNATGYVYQIKDVSIDEIKNNLIIISGKIYDMRVAENDELQFYTVVQNEKIEVVDFFKDVYGNTYICNNKIETIDYNNNTIYYKPQQQKERAKYLFSAEGVVIERSTLKKFVENFVTEDIGVDEKYFFDELCVIKDGYFYDARSFVRVNIMSGDSDGSCDWVLSMSEISYAFLDIDTIVLYTKNNCAHLGLKSNCLYYNDLYGDHKFTDPQVVLNRLSFEYAVELIADVEAVNISSCYAPGDYTEWLFEKTTLTETIYYKIIKGANGNPQVVDETYVPPAQTVITLQPLNK